MQHSLVLLRRKKKKNGSVLNASKCPSFFCSASSPFPFTLSFIIGLVISTTFAPNAVDEHLQKQEDESCSVSEEQQVKGALQMAQIQNHDAVSVLQWR